MWYISIQKNKITEIINQEERIVKDEQTVQTLATTEFVEDKDMVINDNYTISHMDDTTVKGTSIYDFFLKPQEINKVSWGLVGVHPRSTVLYSFSLYTAFLSNTYWTNKQQGFSLIRGTMKVKIVLNANPFQQGKLLLSFLPCYSTINTIDPSYGGMHASTSLPWSSMTGTLAPMTSATQQPNITIDCRDTSATISIPFVSPYNFFDVTGNSYDPGTFFLWVLSPLATGASGNSTVDVTTYGWFEDVEIAAPSVGQSSTRSKSKRTLTKELNATNSGQVTKMLNSVANVALSARNVPLISSYANQLEWVTRNLAKVTSAFGFSKPTTQKVPEIFSSQFDRYGATSDGTDTSYPLGISSTNMTLVNDHMSCRSEDEMSMKFLLQQEAVVLAIDWPAATATNNSLLSSYIGSAPLSGNWCVGGTRTNTKTATFFVGPPVYYLANLFQYWRGSLKLRLKIIKTEFHTGRLLVVWTPCVKSYTALDNDTSQLALREIIDIVGCNEIVLELPYLLASNYIPTDQFSGFLDIRVLNELRAPETVKDHVEILVYLSAGDDFEFQVPVSMHGDNIYSSILPFSGQMDRVVVDDVIGGYPRKRVNLNYASESTGEICTSLKQLLARNSPIYQTTMVVDGTAYNFISIWPWLAGATYEATTGVAGPNAGGDLFSFLSPMYAFYRGPVRVKCTSETLNGTVKIMESFVAYNQPRTGVASQQVISAGIGMYNNRGAGNTTWIATPAATLPLMGGVSPAIAQYQGVSAFEVPYYCATKFSPVLRNTTSNVIPTDSSAVKASAIPVSKLVMQSAANLKSYYIERSFPETFQLGYFIGCPPVFSSST